MRTLAARSVGAERFGAYTENMTDTLQKALSRDEAVRRLRALEPDVRALGVLSLNLFGSTARNEARPDSDIDLFGEVDHGLAKGWSYFALSGRIGDLMGRKVDFIERENLHPMLKDRIEASAVAVF
ncbi:nucleotidyltransferase domain-containing protein [uncultured Brevundimonas sp.]|uniref:nucleotidyltransferase family protein n=1 Tax=uncultured Brevundimonas sp. TaxID=213418 RepID=UPI002626B115|nr:nucleotidyltransferase domain-containing protein [uncultured Brevundimonas sp.]